MIWDHFSLMTGNVEHIFIYFLVICRFSSGEYRFRSFAHFKKSNYLLFEFWNWVACVPHVLLILTPYQLYYLQIFSLNKQVVFSFCKWIPLLCKKYLRLIRPFVTTWMDLEGIMLSEISQREKGKHYIYN